MGNDKMKHYRCWVNIASPIVSEVTVVETWIQPTRVVVTQSLDARITTTWVETIVTPNMNVVRRGILIAFVAKLGSGWNGILIGRKLNGNTTLPTTTTRVVGTPQMVFSLTISQILFTHAISTHFSSS
jgi:hypothetical protein